MCIVGFLAGGLMDLDYIPVAVRAYIGGVRVHSGRLLHGIALVGGGAMCEYAGGYLHLIVLKDTINKAIVELKIG